MRDVAMATNFGTKIAITGFVRTIATSVMARYSNLLPVGILRVMFQLVFVCTYIMLCLSRGTVHRR